MRYVGLDAHWRQSTFCVLDDRGRKILSRTIKGPWSGERRRQRQGAELMNGTTPPVLDRSIRGSWGISPRW